MNSLRRPLDRSLHAALRHNGKQRKFGRSPRIAPTAHDSTPPPSPASRKQSIDDIIKTRKVPLFGAAAAALALGLFISSLIVAGTRQPCQSHAVGRSHDLPTGRPSHQTRQSAASFDRDLDSSEWLMGYTKLRRRLAASAGGHVLEIAMGTGRNLEYYDWDSVCDAANNVDEKYSNRRRLKKSGWVRQDASALSEIQSFTGIDISTEVLGVALGKLRNVLPAVAEQLPKHISSEAAPGLADGAEVASAVGGKLRILKCDAQNPLPLPPLSQDSPKYDTVLQTFGLCSVDDPTSLIVNMAAVVKPETGRILLLEHGRSWLDFLNGMLDRHAEKHFQRYGCWWNRDIERILRDAAERVPALEVLRLEKPGWFQFGTTIKAELRVREASLLSDEPGTAPISEDWWSMSKIVTIKPPSLRDKQE